ncbi:uncharacterized protein LOC111262109 isoform X2 [Varroa jacobsoni]|uniref:Uncharacterized protein n=1 Tax=Varroa destructor TaxID=109461 RepID=A0A7M7KQ57_VARDE|nr:uncharacterized protein LOC111253360 isoform X2 [Varroa destructor]XP_022691851.1 uncharacterized protein LOC111262109 isoform X2 [Varroa jacobsoni]
MRCLSLLASLAIIILCLPVDSAVADYGLTAQESRVGDIIQGVVDHYLGQSRDTSALSLALLDAIQTEKVRSLLDAENHNGDGKPPSATDRPAERKKEHLNVEKRDTPLSPPELLRELVDGDFSNPLNTMYMEVAGQHKNCTKRKRRRKKPKFTGIGNESRNTAPSYIVAGMTPQTQRTLTEYSHTGVPPVGNVDIPRLIAEEQSYFEETTTRSSAYSSDGSALSPYGITERPGIIPKDSETSTTASFTESTYKQSNFASDSSTLFPPPASTRSSRRTSFEKFERSTPLPQQNAHETDVVLPKRAKTPERLPQNGFTEPPWMNVDPLNKRISAEADHDPNSYAEATGFSRDLLLSPRASQLQSGSTTVAPKAQTDASRVQLKPASLTMLPTMTTTTSTLSDVSHSIPTVAPSFPLRTAEPSQQLRTLVPSSLNKGTLQHFSLYPKYPQVNTQSKIILAVGGARYAPLPLEVVMALGNKRDVAADQRIPKNDFNNVLENKNPPSFLDEPPVDDSKTVEAPLVELTAKNDKMIIDPSVETIKYKGQTVQPPLLVPTPPSELLSMPPQIVDEQVLVFSSLNTPNESDGSDAARTAPAVPITTMISNFSKNTPAVVGTGRTIMLQPINYPLEHAHDVECNRTRGLHECDPPAIESRLQTKDDRDDVLGKIAIASKSTTATEGAHKIDLDDDDEDVTATASLSRSAQSNVTAIPRLAMTVNHTTANITMPQAPMILMQVPAPEIDSDAATHGYARGTTRLHVPFVYHVHKSLQSKKNNQAREDETETTDPDGKVLSRTLISLPNNPLARLAPLKADYYKYGKSSLKGYLPKSFLKLERLRYVKPVSGQHRSMLLFE